MSTMSLPTAVKDHHAAARRRLSSPERREQILRAARRVVAEDGLQATTDQVARAAGVSQPYVVRLFGTKRDLFVEVYREAAAAVVRALGSVPAGPDARDRMAAAYVALLADRDLLRVFMHGFIAGADEEIGRIARHTLGEAYRLFEERVGGTPDEARQFVAFGMLINVLLAVDAPAHLGEDPGLDGLIECTLKGAEGLDEALLRADRA